MFDIAIQAIVFKFYNGGHKELFKRIIRYFR